MQNYDLYPLKYKNYVNSSKYVNLTPNAAAFKIQKAWKKYLVKKNTGCNLGYIGYIRRRFPSWFPF